MQTGLARHSINFAWPCNVTPLRGIVENLPYLPSSKKQKQKQKLLFYNLTHASTLSFELADPQLRCDEMRPRTMALRRKEVANQTPDSHVSTTTERAVQRRITSQDRK